MTSLTNYSSGSLSCVFKMKILLTQQENSEVFTRNIRNQAQRPKQCTGPEFQNTKPRTRLQNSKTQESCSRKNILELNGQRRVLFGSNHSWDQSIGHFHATKITEIMQPMPPETTDAGAPSQEATAPASSSPN